MQRTGVGSWAEFTGVSPGSSQGATTGGASHSHADLGRAGDSSITASEDVQEAVADTSVWRKEIFFFKTHLDTFVFNLSETTF